MSRKDVSDTAKYRRYIHCVWVSDPCAENADPAKEMLNAIIVTSSHAMVKDCHPTRRILSCFIR